MGKKQNYRFSGDNFCKNFLKSGTYFLSVSNLGISISESNYIKTQKGLKTVMEQEY